MKYQPHKYQDHGYKHIIDNKECGLFLDMGLGKTVITLTAINELIYRECEISRALVVAPKNVTKTVWKQEAAKWDHLKHMRISIVWGTEKERLSALREEADVYVINRENLVWLIQRFQGKFPFGMVVLDELSSFKNPASKRFKAMKIIRPRVKRIVGLTGTPAPNGLIDLWAQVYLLDQGERLEKTISGYRERYFAAEKQEGYVVYSYRLRKDAEKTIYNKIGDICISMKAEDYLDLPPLIENDIILDLEDSVKNQYDKFEEDSVLELMNEPEITALNAAALTNKLLQFANGAIYHEDRSWTELHKSKLDALDEIIEEAQGQNVMVFYGYKHDLERIKKRFPQARTLKTPKDVEDWNLGKIPLLVLHPASAGHGLNLQDGGHIMVWFGLNWSLELYQQARARLMRQGQKLSVIMHRIICRGTMDEDVVSALSRKEQGQNALMEAIKVRVDRYKTKYKRPTVPINTPEMR